MVILGIDTSAIVSTCAICDIGEHPKVIASGSLNTKLTHSQTLVPFMESLMKGADISLDDIDAFAVSVGPGSFTGLRIGISAIKGMAFAQNKPVRPVSTLLGIAHNFTVTDAIICAVMDARCNQVYNALFRVQNGLVMRLCDDRALFIDDLKKELSKYSERIILAGDGADLVYSKINDGLIELAPPALKYQSGTGICFASEQCSDISAEALMPTYLRLPQAERERLAKEAKK
ncbi:MAG: tRNA (adenosine(37)-N6)-threonylcarbamoyltransferase complex dimerization subunit type 1 TsaB [Ruminiclostridium sp.]|nr:tRNA (adenosine(37)-N6)-threonylcarbamoyltransferase complex dimerization subunit type 1 TsaB [Ruminiclostridium sp.]MBQ8410641.1 tRNA (adenosine(37)-N6)-threonylcarbamoyltransferase complex dimerization subunit type 1 TsaB [Ruminiclostridium sp.]MBQ8843107.1 tRNA (adenosine(37)-N6)-threonylcarbamoyltransferase complex dimerization subunit type 1 TsaB [Ruminiclostridium sp.]